jgi:predicted ATPase
MAMIADMVTEDAQFVIATHSPILLAYPGARIVSFDEIPVRLVEYSELESVRLVRDFLAAPERYVRGIVNGHGSTESD